MNNTNEKNEIKPSDWFWNSILVAAWLLTGFIKIEYIFIIWVASTLPALWFFIFDIWNKKTHVVDEKHLWFWITPLGLVGIVFYCCYGIISYIINLFNKFKKKT